LTPEVAGGWVNLIVQGQVEGTREAGGENKGGGWGEKGTSGVRKNGAGRKEEASEDMNFGMGVRHLQRAIIFRRKFQMA
jgi:hypothetical protein